MAIFRSFFLITYRTDGRYIYSIWTRAAGTRISSCLMNGADKYIILYNIMLSTMFKYTKRKVLEIMKFRESGRDSYNFPGLRRYKGLRNACTLITTATQVAGINVFRDSFCFHPYAWDREQMECLSWKISKGSILLNCTKGFIYLEF